MTAIVLPTPVAKTDTFEIWRRKLNQTIQGISDVADELNTSSYFDTQFRLAVIESTKAGFEEGKVRNRSEVFSVSPQTITDSFVAGAGPTFPFVLSVNILTSSTIVVTNTTTLATVADTDYTINYATNTVTLTGGCSPSDGIDIQVANAYVALDFSSGDGYYSVYVDCNTTPVIGFLYNVASYSPFPTTSIVPIYKLQVVAGVIDTNTIEDMRTWATVAIDSAIITTGKLEFREIFASLKDFCVATSIIPISLAGNISVYVDGLRQSQYGGSSDYTVVDDAGWVKIQFPSDYPAGTSVLVVANQDDHNLSIDPKYDEEIVTTPAKDTFITGFSVANGDTSIAVYVGGVRQLPSSYTVTAPNIVTLDSAVSNTTVMITKNEAQGESITTLPGGATDDLLTRTENSAVWKAPEFDASAIVSGTIDAARLPLATTADCIAGFKTDVLVTPNGYFASYAKNALNNWIPHEVASKLDFTITNATTFINFHTLAHYVATKYGAVIERPDNIENFKTGHIKHTPFTNLNYITTDPAFQTSSGLVDDQWILVCNEEGKIAYMPVWAGQRGEAAEYGEWTEIPTPAAVSGWNCLQVEAVSVPCGLGIIGGGVAPVSAEGLVENQGTAYLDALVRYITEHAFSNDAKIYAIEKDGAGNYYFGGKFSRAGGIRATNIVKYIPSTNTFSAIGDPLDIDGGGGVSGTNAVVYAIKAIGTDIYVGGSFTYYNTNINQTAVSNIVKWNGAAWSALGTGANDAVYVLESDGTDLYAGGAFTLAGGVASTRRIAKWDGAVWTPLATGAPDGTVYTLKYDTGTLYAGGSFSSMNGVANTLRLAKWDGAVWSTLLGANTPNDTVFAIDTGTVSAGAYSGKSYVFFGGNFTQCGAYIVGAIAKYNITDARIEPIERGALGNKIHAINTIGSGDAAVKSVKFYNDYLYISGDFVDMGLNTLPTDISKYRMGGMARFDMTEADFTLTASATNGVPISVAGLGGDEKNVIQLVESTGLALYEGVNYTVDYDANTVTLIVPSTNLAAAETVTATLGWKSLAGHGVYAPLDAGDYGSCMFVDGTNILMGFDGCSVVAKYETTTGKLKKFVADHPIFYFAVFEKPDQTEWRIYRTFKGNIISNENNYSDGYIHSGGIPGWQLVDTIVKGTGAGQHKVRPQIKAHCINQNTTGYNADYPIGTLMGWFVGKTFKYFRTRHTNYVTGLPGTPTRPTDPYSNTWGISELSSVDIDASNQIPADHHVAKWTSFAHAYTGYEGYPQTSEARSGVVGSVDVNDSVEVSGYLWTYASFITDKGVAGYVTLAHTQPFPSAYDYYPPPFAALTSGQWAGTYGDNFNMSESSGEPVAALAYHNPNSEISGGSSYGSRTLYVTEFGFPHEQVNHWNNAITISPATICNIPAKFVAGCDFNFLSNRSCGKVVNFKTIEDKDVLNAGKAMIQNESADLAIITATRIGDNGSNTYGHKNQTSFVSKAFTTDYSPAPTMAVEKVVSNGADTVALVKSPINAVWYMEETDTGGYPVSFSENLVDIFCEGEGINSRFFLFGEENLYVSSDGQTWTKYSLPVTVVPNAIEMSFSNVDFRHVVVSGGDAMYSDDNGATWNTFNITGASVGYDPIEITHYISGTSSGFCFMNSDGSLDICFDGSTDILDFPYWNVPPEYAGKAISLQFSENASKVLVGTTDGEIILFDDTGVETPTITVDGVVGTSLGGLPVKISGGIYTFVKVQVGSLFKFYATPDGVNFLSFRVPATSASNYGNITTNGGTSYYISETSLNKPTGKLPTYFKVTL